MNMSDMTSIPLRTLGGNLTVHFNVFIKVNEKPVLYFRKDQNVDRDRRMRLLSKEVYEVYIAPEDLPLYEGYLNFLQETCWEKTGFGANLYDKAKALQGLFEEKFERVLKDIHSEAHYGDLHYFSAQFIKLLDSTPQLAQHMLDFETNGFPFLQHGIAVATLTHLLYKESSLFGSPDYHPVEIFLGALLHDLGHHSSSVNTQRSIKELSPSELSAYTQHPELAANKFAELRHIDPLVSEIMRYHESRLQGGGFPPNLDLSVAPAPAALVAVCNALDRKYRYENQSPKEALKALLIDQMGLLPLDLMKSLQSVLKKHSIIEG